LTLNEISLGTFAGYYLKEKIDYELNIPGNFDTEKSRKLESEILQYVVIDREKFEQNEKIKDLYRELCNLRKQSDDLERSLTGDFVLLSQFRDADNHLDSIISGKEIPESNELENPILNTSMEIERNLELDEKINYYLDSDLGFFKHPDKVLLASLAHHYLDNEQFTALKTDLEIDVDDIELVRIFRRIEDFITIFNAGYPENRPSNLKDLDDIQSSLDFFSDKIETEKREMERCRSELKELDMKITSAIFDLFEKNALEFSSSNRILLEKARECSVILGRLRQPEKKNEDLFSETDGWVTRSLGISNERISDLLMRWDLYLPGNRALRKSKRDLFPYNISRQMLIQEDIFLQDFARRELIREINKGEIYSSAEPDMEASEKMIGSDLQKLMDVTSNLGKQIFKMNTFLSQSSGRPPARESTSMARVESGVNQLELGEFSRLIKKFKLDLEHDLKKQSQKEVSLKLLGVADFLDNLIYNFPKDCPEEMKSIEESIEIIRGKLIRVLAGFGIEEISTKGEKFNAEFHECIDLQSVEGIEPNIVIKDVIRGYKMGSEIIRYPKVIVSS